MTMDLGGLGIADLADAQETRRDQRGVLYTARDPKLDRPVSVRLFPTLPNPVDRERFNHEAQLIGRLSAHPNVVTVFNAGFTSDQAPYLVTEPTGDIDLASLSRSRGPMPWPEAVDLVLQISAGLEQAHRAGVLHRDLRPETVHLVGSVPKLNDFVMSVFLPGGPGAAPVTPDGNRDPGPELHRAPETFDDVWDERVDLYAAASILHQLIDGHPPMWRPAPDSMDAFRLRLDHQRPPSLSEDRAPAALNVFVTAALAKDPVDRPQSAAEFSEELRLIREGRVTGMTPSVLHNTGAVTAAVPAVSNPPLDRTVVSALAVPVTTPAASVTTPAVSAAAPAALFTAPAASVTAPVVSAAPATYPVPANGVNLPTAFAGAATVEAPSAEIGAAPAAVEWAPPTAWAPPAPDVPQIASAPSVPPAAPTDGTAVFAQPVEYRDPLAAVPPGEMPPLPQVAEPEPVRSPLFLAAVALLVISLLGFLAVISMTILGSDDEQAGSPLLPDPDAPTVVQANGDGTLTPTSAADTAADGAMTDEAMTEEMTTTTVADTASTTETTVARLQVPNLVGQNVESATQQLQELGFEVVVVGRQTANAQPGTVTQQKPDAGNLVTLPLTVTLYIPRAANLPPMVGRSADAVCLELQALGLVCNRVNQNHDQIPAGSVIATNPVEGSLFTEGSSVALTVSTGPVTNITIPNVAGRSREEAEATLREAGFNTIAFAMRASNAPKDLVFGSMPAAGQILASNRPITILISNGTATPTVPELVGLTQAEAEARLVALGLEFQVTLVDLPAEDPGIGMVLASDPERGTEVTPGSTVTISVGREATSTTTTTIVEETTTTTESTPDTTVAETTTTTVVESASSPSTDAP
ncbi:MAG: PASTA domain-containing protein [Actinomycetota bacterium]